MAVRTRPTPNQSQSRRFEDPLVSSRAFALLFLVAMSIAILLLFAPKAHAANDLYWDLNGTANNNGGGGNQSATGTWGTGQWNNQPSGSGGTITTTTNNTNDVHFSAGSNYGGISTITVSGTQAANSIFFEEGTLTLSGGTITLGGGGGVNSGITVNGTVAGPTTINSALSLASTAETFTNSSAFSLSITGGITGTSNLTITNTAAGGTAISGGSVANAGSLTINNNAAGGTTISTSVVNSGNITINNNGSGGTTFSSTIANSGDITINNNSTGATTISAGSVNNTGTITNSGSGSATTTISSPIGFNVTGVSQNSTNSALVLSGANTSYTGTTTLTAGTLQGQNTANTNVLQAFGSGQLNLNGGTLQLRANGAGIAQTISVGNNVVVGGNTTIDANNNGSNTNNTFSFGTLSIGTNTLGITGGNSYGVSFSSTNLTGAATFNPTSGNISLGSVTGTNTSLTLDGTGSGNTVGAINTGTGGLTKSNTGTWLLSGASTYTGATNVSGGTLNQIGAFGNTAISITGGTLSLQTSGAVTQNTITVAGGSLAETTANALSGTASLTVSSGTATLSQANDFSGTTTVSGSGVLQLNVGAITNSNLMLNGGTLQLRKDSTAGTFTDASTTISGTSTINVDHITLGSGIQLSLGAVSIGAGTLNITGANTYSLALDTTTLTGGVTFNPTTANVSIASITGANQNLTLGGTSTANTVGAITTGSGTLTKNTATTWTLSGNSTYTGATSISSGTLNQTGTFGNTAIGVSGGTLNVQNAGAVSQNTLTVNGGTLNTTVDNALTGSASLVVSSGSATLGRVGSYTGTTTLSGTGTLILNFGNAISSSAVSITGGTFTENLPNALSGTTSLSINTAGTVSIGQVNTYTGGTTLTAGTLTLSNTGALGTGSVTVNGGTLNLVTGGATTTFSNLSGTGGTVQISGSGNTGTLSVGSDNSNTVYSGLLKGDTSTGTSTTHLSLTKVGTGSLTLTGANTYNGTTTIQAGTIVAGNNTALGASSVLLGDTAGLSNASLLTSGAVTIANAITVQSGNIGTITVGGNTANASIFSGAVSLGSGSGNAGKNATFVALAGGSVDFQGVIGEPTGATTVASLTIGDATHSGTVKFSNAGNTYSGSTTIGNGATLEVTKLLNGGTASSLGDSASLATSLILDNGTLKYTGAGDSTNRLFTFGAGGATIDASASANGALNFTGTGSLVASGTGNRTLTLTGSSTGANTLTSVIADPGSGSTSLLKSGAGTWVLGGANTYTGSTTIANGTLKLAGGNDRLPVSSAVTLGDASANSSGILQLSDGTTARNQTLTGLVTAGTGTNNKVVGGAAGTSVLTLNIAGSNTFAGVLGGTGTNENNLALTKTGAGTLTLSGTNTYNGDTTISAGTLQLGAANVIADGTGKGNVIDNGILDLNGFSETINGLSGSGVVDTVSGGSVTLTVGNNDATSAFSGSIQNSTGTLGLTKTGTGTLTLSGANTYTGATAVNAGALTVTGTLGNTAVTLGGGVLNLNSAAAISQNTVTVNNASSVVTESTTNALSGSAALAVSNGSVSLSRANDFSGFTTVTGGTLQLGNVGAIANSNLFLNGGTLQLRKDTSAGTFADVSTTIGANTTIDVNRLTTGTNVQLSLGATTIGAFTVGVTGGNGYSLGLGPVTLTGAAIFNPTTASVAVDSITGAGQSVTIDGSASGNTVGAITTGTGAVTKTGASTWTMTGVNTYTGATSVNAGTLNITGILDNTAVTVGGATLNLNGASAINRNTLTVNNAGGVVTENTTNALSGTANLAISNGSVTLSQSNDFSGSTTVSGGALQLSNANAIANSNLTLSGGTLQLRNDSATAFADASTTIAATTTFDVNRVSTGTGVQLSLGPTNITGAFTINITGGNSYTLGLGAVTINGTTTFNPTTGSIAIGSITGTDRNVVLGGTAAGNSIGAITTGAGTLTKNTASTWTLSGNSSYTGATSVSSGSLNQAGSFGNTAIGISGGTLSLQNAGAVTLNTVTVNGGTLTETANNSLSGNAALTISSGSATLSNANDYAGATILSGGTLTLSGAGAISGSAVSITGGTFTETTSNGLSGTASLSINIPGTLTLSQANNFTGSTTVNGTSTLQLSNTGALTNSGLVLNGGTLQLRKDTSAGTFNNAGTTIAANTTINVDRITTGTGVQLSLGSVSIGAFTLNITGGNSYSLGLGATTLTGNATFNPTTANVAIASVTGTDKNLTLGGTIATGVNSVGAITTGAGTVTKNTASTWTLSGNSTYTGATSITTGTVNQTGAFGNTAIGLTGGTLNLQGAGAVNQNTLTVNGGTLAETVGNALSGTAALTVTSGTVTLSQPNSYTGNTTLSGGTLTLSGPGAINGSAISITGGTFSETVANALTGSTSLSLSLPGTFVMSLANNYTGSTTLNSGTLQLTNTGALTNSAVVLNGGTLDLRKDSSAGTFSNAGTTIAADTTINVDRIATGTGVQLSLGSVSIGGFTLNITGANTYSLGLGAISLTGNATFNPTTANVSIASVTGTDKNLTLGGTSIGNSVGAISTGAGSVTKNTASTWTLSGNSTYTGATSISSGTLNQAGTFGNTAISLTGGTLSLQGAGAVNQNTLAVNGGTLTETVANGLSGSASLLINTAGTVTLSLANNYTGTTTLNSGTLQLANTGAIANSNLVLNAGTLQLRSNSTGTFSTSGVTIGGNTTIDVARVSGGGSGNQLSLGGTSIGAFTLNITGGNSYSLGLGATTLTGAATFNPTTASVAIASITAVDKNLTLGGTASGNSAGAITTGTGSLTKSGTSTWTLTGTNTYTGATNINAGTLNITGVLDNTAVMVGAATLNLNGAGAASQNTVTLNNASSVLTENTTNALTGSASLAINNGSATLSQANNYNGSTTLTAGILQLGNFGSLTNSALTLNGGTLQLRNDTAGLFADASSTIGANTTIDVNRNSSGTGLQLGLGATNITGAFTLNITGGNGYSLGLGATTINGTTAFNPTTASVAIASITGSDRDLTLDGTAAGNTVGAIATGTGAVTKSGTSTWTMTGTNTYTGATNVNAGTLNITGVLDNTAVTVGAGALNLNGALAISQNTLTVNNASAVVTENTANALSGTAILAISNGSVALSQANNYTGSTTVSGGVLQLGDFGAITNSALFLNGGTLQLRNDAAGLFSDASTTIGGNTTIDVNQTSTGSGLQLALGATNITGAFTLNITGGNGYSLGLGATTINGTTVFNPTTASVAIASINGTDRDVTLGGTAAGNIVGAIATGTGAVTKTGTSVWTMNGTNTYTGATNVNGGTLNITGVLDNTAVNVSAATLNLNGASAISQNTLTVNNAGALITENIANALSGTVNLTVNNGSVILSHANDYSGVTTVNGGTLQLSDAGAIANSALFLNGGMLQLCGDVNTSFAMGSTTIGADSTIDVNQITSGSDVQLNLGATSMGAVTLNVTGGNDFGLGLGPVTLTGDATFNPTSADMYIESITGADHNVTFAGTAIDNTVGAITTGAGSVTKTGSSTWTITGTSTYTGGTNINGGTLEVADAGALGTSGTISFGGGTLRYVGNNTDYSTRFSGAANQDYRIDTNTQNVTFSGALTSSGGNLTKVGAGTLTLTGNNTFTGTTTINGGTLNANATGGDKALGGTTSIVVNSGGTLMTSSDQQFNAAPSVTLAGGTIATNGTSQTFGALTLTSSSIIDMGNGASILNFANSSSQTWATGAIISIWNWSGDKDNGGGIDQLFFGNDNTSLTPTQLSQFQFYSDAGVTPFWSGTQGVMLASGEVVPVPEPSTWIGAFLALGTIGYSQRRRLASLVKRRS